MYIVNAVQAALSPKKVEYQQAPMLEKNTKKKGKNDSEIAAIQFGEFAKVFNLKFKE